MNEQLAAAAGFVCAQDSAIGGRRIHINAHAPHRIPSGAREKPMPAHCNIVIMPLLPYIKV